MIAHENAAARLPQPICIRCTHPTRHCGHHRQAFWTCTWVSAPTRPVRRTGRGPR